MDRLRQAETCRQEAERLKEEAEKADIRVQDLKIEEVSKAGQIAGLEVLAQTHWASGRTR